MEKLEDYKRHCNAACIQAEKDTNANKKPIRKVENNKGVKYENC